MKLSMIIKTLRRFIALPVLGLALVSAAPAADFSLMPVETLRLDDFARGKKAMEVKKWIEARLAKLQSSCAICNKTANLAKSVATAK